MRRGTNEFIQELFGFIKQRLEESPDVSLEAIVDIKLIVDKTFIDAYGD